VELLKRTFSLDVLECDTCHGRLRLLAMVSDDKSIARFVRKLGEPSEPPPRLPARGPPYTRRTSAMFAIGSPSTTQRFERHFRARYRKALDQWRDVTRGRPRRILFRRVPVERAFGSRRHLRASAPGEWAGGVAVQRLFCFNP